MVVEVVVALTEVSSSTRSVTNASTFPPIDPASPVPPMQVPRPSALVKASLSLASSPQRQPKSMSAPFLTALDQQLAFLNAFFPAAFNFFEVQRLADVLIPTSGVRTSSTRLVTFGPISVVPVPLTQAPSPSAAAKLVARFMSSASRQLMSTEPPFAPAPLPCPRS